MSSVVIIKGGSLILLCRQVCTVLYMYMYVFNSQHYSTCMFCVLPKGELSLDQWIHYGNVYVH